MRKLSGLAVVVLVVLAGCSSMPGFADQPPGSTPQAGTGGAAGAPGAPPDPPGDRIGWEDGVWYNESIPVTNDDGLNASERELVVARTEARVERVRHEEFKRSVPITIVSRQEYRNRSRTSYSAAFRTFDNAKFEALFMIGEDRDSLAVQHQNRGSNVLAYYDTHNDTITLISSGGQPRIDSESTLAHELTHALQDQYHNLSALQAPTRDGHNGLNGLIEGEAHLVDLEYKRHCGHDWQCVSGGGSGAGSMADLNVGVYLLNFFPYASGPQFVQYLHDHGGWAAVDRAFDDPPESAEQVIYPEKYVNRDSPTTVSLPAAPGGGWERVRPDAPEPGQHRPAYATLGQSGLSAMFAYTAFVQGYRPSIVSANQLFTGDQFHPYNYDFPSTKGWEGDRLAVYRNPAAGANESAYVWRLAWQSPADAREFADTYRELLRFWGAQSVDGHPNAYRIPEGTGGFADAFRVTRSGDTVTITNAPTVSDLSAFPSG
ncbi:MAG: Hvo_1808 family surface protein [Haloarculaceae archaeon]